MPKTAIILGATGLTGSLLTALLIKDPNYCKIKLFTRRPTTFSDPKIEEIKCDLLNLNVVKTEFTGDIIFCCIGTTKAKTPNRDLYYKIDYGIPIEAAQLAKENSIDTFLVISSVGTSDKSPFFYVRTKGEMERDLLKIGIPNTYIMKPAFINGRPDEDRKGEKLLKLLMKVTDFFMIGPLKKYKSAQASQIAKAMAHLGTNYHKEANIGNHQIKTLSHQYES
ncbi:NAD(P)H-binding protein [uncultured Dokdonia sp.]|uniref:NAD(P)H-binding protein n=1 Tax=uncultured Dokdonia sp. TaxID=575653 RepID=UPI002629DA3A|nr:NAD(P)H-binding protein [uncultured Dokdonia sp.]